MIDCRNNGTLVAVVSVPPAPGRQSDYHYDQMVRRAANHYDYRFSQI